MEYYVLDTSYLLNNPAAVFEKNTVVTPTVIRELQKLEKEGRNQYKVREVHRNLHRSDEVYYLTVTDHSVNANILKGYAKDYGDNRIIAEVRVLSEMHPDDEINIVTSDIGLANTAKSMGYNAYTALPNDKTDNQDNGIHNLYFSTSRADEKEALLATEIIQQANGKPKENYNPLNMAINEYVVLWDKDKPNYKIDYRTGEKVVSGYADCGVFRYNGDTLVKVPYNQTISNKYNTITPLNARQRAAFDLVLNKDIPIKLLTGVSGSGKTYINVNYALQGVEQGLYNKIVWIRNPIDLEDTRDIGALPGTADEKLMQYAMPIADILGGEDALYELLWGAEGEYGDEQPTIVIENLNAIRGRSFSNTIVLVSEAQNLTPNQIKVLVGRIGEGSALLLDGDTNQGDTTKFKGYNGIRSLQDNLRQEPLFGEVALDLVERSNVAKLVELL